MLKWDDYYLSGAPPPLPHHSNSRGYPIELEQRESGRTLSIHATNAHSCMQHMGPHPSWPNITLCTPQCALGRRLLAYVVGVTSIISFVGGSWNSCVT